MPSSGQRIMAAQRDHADEQHHERREAVAHDRAGDEQLGEQRRPDEEQRRPPGERGFAA